jgi:DNA-binding transcriptional LysR family regulator
MELRQLEYFSKVSKLRSFTRAAEQLHVAQPSVTNAIRKLEEEFELQLFDRTQKKVVLTSEGEIFLQRVERILYEIRETFVEMNDYKILNKGTIKIGVPPMIGAYLFPDIFTQFKKAYPDLEVLVFEEGSMAARTMLEKAELDLGLIILPNSTNVFHTMPVITQQIVLCTSLDHLLCHEASVSFPQLKNEDFILLKEDSFHRHIIIQECKKHQFTPKIVFSSGQIQTIKALVASGVGISFLMQMVTKDNPRITTIPLTDPIELKIGLAWKKDRYVSKAAQAFIRFLHDYICLPEFVIKTQ